MKIEAAAILYKDTIYSVPRPGRHHDVIRMMLEQGLPVEATHNLDAQGFVTDEGDFVRRKPAVHIAREAGQLIREPTPWYMLTSEDVW